MGDVCTGLHHPAWHQESPCRDFVSECAGRPFCDVFAIGDDRAGKLGFLKDEVVEIVYLPSTPEMSATQIKQELLKQFRTGDI